MCPRHDTMKKTTLVLALSYASGILVFRVNRGNNNYGNYLIWQLWQLWQLMAMAIFGQWQFWH